MPRMQCPACHGPAISRTYGTHTPLYREVYYQCKDWRCGCVFVVEMESVRVTRPSNLENPIHTLPRAAARFFVANDADDPPRIVERGTPA